jgi:hypothetical protein
MSAGRIRLGYVSPLSCPRANNGLQRTRTQQVFHLWRSVRAADAWRYAAKLET